MSAQIYNAFSVDKTTYLLKPYKRARLFWVKHCFSLQDQGTILGPCEMSSSAEGHILCNHPVQAVEVR